MTEKEQAKERFTAEGVKVKNKPNVDWKSVLSKCENKGKK